MFSLFRDASTQVVACLLFLVLDLLLLRDLDLSVGCLETYLLCSNLELSVLLRQSNCMKRPKFLISEIYFIESLLVVLFLQLLSDLSKRSGRFIQADSFPFLSPSTVISSACFNMVLPLYLSRGTKLEVSSLLSLDIMISSALA